jgi:TRAP-type C4-dicarboxylate transport system permease small subunit
LDLYFRLVDAIDRVVRWTAIAACAAIAVVMSLQVFFRYVLNDSLQWSEEISVWLQVWMVFLGAAVLTRENAHVTVTAGIARLPPAARAWAVIAAKVMTLVFLAFLLWYGMQAFNASSHRVSPSTGLSSKWAKLALPTGALLMILAGVATILRDWIELRRGNHRHFEQQLAEKIEG